MIQEKIKDEIYTPMHLSLSDSCNNQYEVLFNNRVLVTSEHELLEAVKYDHVCAELKNGQRKGDNFLGIDCLFVDVDNDDSKDEDAMKLWDDYSKHMTIELFKKMFQNNEFVLYTSRNHNREKEIDKNGVKITRPAREKFHVLFPLGKDIRNSQDVKELLVVLCESFIREDGIQYFDGSLKDPCRMFFGSRDNPSVLWNSGRSILEWIDEHKALGKIDQQVEKDINDDWFNTTVIPRLSIDDVFLEVKNKQSSGSNHIKGLCPFHNDSNPSFSIHGKKLLWICHAGCGSGNVIQYIAKVRAMTNRAATEYLCNKAGCEYLNPKKSKSSLDILLSLAAEEELFHGPDKISYTKLITEGKGEVIKIESEGFKKWLKTKYFKRTGQTPEYQVLKDAVDVLSIKARDEGKEAELNLRVARIGESVYLDLCDEKGQVVEINKNGWSVINQSPVFFLRKPGMLALEAPLRNGSLEKDLRPFLNLKSDRDWNLCVGWLISTLNAAGPFPILVIQGEQGSGKSFMAKVLRHVIDPNTSPVRNLQNDERDLMIQANNSWILAFDNISALTPTISDCLCILASGGGYSKRKNFTDDDEMLFNAARPIMINGIEYTTRYDIADRAVFLNLSPISDEERKTEQELWQDFLDMRPYILGALCDVVSGILRDYGSVELNLKSRMADFEMWISAAETTLGWEAGSFSRVYSENRSLSKAQSLEDDYVAVAIKEMIEKQGNNKWSGNATELLREIDTYVDERIKKNNKLWPQAANGLARRLDRAASALRSEGILIERKEKHIDISKSDK